MEKKTLLAIIISIAILLIWDLLVIQPRKDETPQEVTGVEETAKPEITSPILKIPGLESTPPIISDEETIVAETPLYRATWDTKGGRLISVKLKKYKESMDEDASFVEVIKTPMPTVNLNEELLDTELIYTSSQKGTLTSQDAPLKVTMSAQAAQGITIHKIYTLDPKKYTIEYLSVIENTTNERMTLNVSMLLDDLYPLDDKGKRYIFEGPVLLNGKRLEEFKISKVKKVGAYREFSGEINWFGFEDKYFLKAVIPKNPVETMLNIKRIDDNIIRLHYGSLPAVIEPGSQYVNDYLIFIGPKELETLKESGYGLKKALDFGFFDLIAKPMLMAMNWIYSFTHSYGWSIIILTIIIKILLYPLTLKSFTSMKGLQKIQPLMKEIQAKYKDDKQKLNQEMMKLYSDHKINPMGGCLPMLLQIPILFALYRVFFSAIELRHTPFYIVGTWLPDLSAKDPYFITPILMGLSQFVMQKMTPSTGDATQQKVMLFMPVFFTILFLSFPSGLVIYWLVSNVLSIAQQAYINRKDS
ncbi:MAG TPA: membrane protein insertase YidC [Deltaproteobacteria bacterium]|nr:membrane protein insertase YidC [Deltaproteobacteria bacterium]